MSGVMSLSLLVWFVACPIAALTIYQTKGIQLRGPAVWFVWITGIFGIAAALSERKEREDQP